MIHVEPFEDRPFEIVPNAPLTLDIDPLALADRFFPAILESSENSGLHRIIAVNSMIAERSCFLNSPAGLIQSGSSPTVPHPR